MEYSRKNNFVRKEWLNLFKKTNYNGDYDWFKV